jgi:outer membrane receptor protein involved in Fe transport
MTATTRDEAQLLNRTVLASTIGALLAGGSAAQAQAPAGGPAPALEEITVTGSRIVRRDLDAASPIMTVDTRRLEDTSTLSIESVLNQMPQFVPDNTQFDAGTGVASGSVTPGIATVNLRGIGSNRTLVLVDGRRAQPANASLVVDLNTIPSAAIERVETITGGASAVYGADALAGVVNFVLKDDFEGVEMDLQTSGTAEGDGSETRFTSLIGVNGEGGRGNVMLGVEWYKREEVMQKDREFYRNGWEDSTNQTGGFLNATGFSPGQVTVNTSNLTINQSVLPVNRASQAAVDALFAPYGIAPGTVNNQVEIYFQPDGRPFTLSGVNYTGPIMSYDVNGDGLTGVHRQPNGSLQQVNTEAWASSPAERRALFGRATFDMNDNLTAFAQANYSNSQVITRAGYPPAITVWQAAVPNDGQRPLPPGLQQLLDSRTYDPDGAAGPLPVTSGAALPWNIFRGIDFMGTPYSPTTESDAYQLMVGVEGSFTNRDWTWDAYVSNGETDTLIFYDNLVSLQRYQFLVAQPNWGAGNFVRGRNYDVSCSTGLPMFTSADPDSGCLEAINSKTRPIQQLSQNIIEANLQGKIADMRSGELRFAAGIANRENKFRYEPGGINDNVSIIEQPMNLFVSNHTAGQTEVSEIYGELLLPATERLNLELGYRYSDYERSGGVDTWKTLVDWSATDFMRIRGGYQVATREPNTEELFAGPRLNTVNDFVFGDPCQVSTTAPWGNRPPSQYPAPPGTGRTGGAPNPNYLQVQALCRALIDRSDTNPANDGASAYDTNLGSTQYPGTGRDAFTRPGLPFFQAENEIPRGNPDVNPEEAKTWTLGVVFTSPGSLENLTASLDFYNIEINDVIATIDSTFVYSKCLNADGISNPTYSLNDPGHYCDMIGRQVQTGERDTTQAPYVNSGMLETRGVDITLNWTPGIGDGGGGLYLNSIVTLLDEFKIQDATGEPILDVRDTLSTSFYGAQYKYKLNNTIGYNLPNGRASVGLNWRYLPEIRSDTATRTPNTTQLGAEAYSVFALNARFSINDRLEFRGGIDNLFDEDPVIVEARPGVDSNTDVTRTEYYDILGRRAYVGVKVSF